MINQPLLLPLALVLAVGFRLTAAFVPSHHNRLVRRSHVGNAKARSPLVSLLGKRRDDEWDDELDDEEKDLLAEQDWRDFRAKLVMSETKEQASSTDSSAESQSQPAVFPADDGDLDGIGSIFQDAASLDSTPTTSSSSSSTASSAKEAANQMTPLDPTQWAYDSGKIIEQGAVILGGVEQDFGFGLRQQYFQKAAILVLDHDENTFTKGIILNRPTDLTLEDDINEGVKWRVWFGGDVQGLNSGNPDIVCLHSLKNPQAASASIQVMKDIQWTSFENAKRLVQVGAAKPTDFWVFMGYAGWGAGQLMGELERKSWYMVATDSQTLLKELSRQSAASDPREAGLDTWTLLMNMIGRSETAKEYSGDFDDLMLKEWALKHLLSTEAGGGAGNRALAADAVEGTGAGMFATDPLERLVKAVVGSKKKTLFEEGTILRASPAERSPFLLEGQEFHKSVVLVLSHDESITVGAILNRPASKGLDIQTTEKVAGKSTKKTTLPLRFGGQFSIKGTEALLWLHCSPTLRSANIGAPVGSVTDGIWKCTSDDVVASISRGLAKPGDFAVISGVSVWTKVPGRMRGLQAEIDDGKFEIVPHNRAKDIWKELSKQDVISKDNLSFNLEAASAAWNAGGGKNDKVLNGSNNKNGKKNGLLPPITGLGDGFDEEDDTVVFKSDVKVEKLSDDALRNWVATFLLGATIG